MYFVSVCLNSRVAYQLHCLAVGFLSSGISKQKHYLAFLHLRSPAFLTLKIPTFFSSFRYSMEIVCKSLKKASKNLFLCFNIQLILVAIHCMTQFLKFLLINLRNQLLKNMFFQGGVKIHPPSGDKGLSASIALRALHVLAQGRRRMIIIRRR